MFKKVLIANRGVIATRVIRTLRSMGVKAVCVYAQADADSLHVLQADESYCLGDGPAASTYLNQGKLLDIIQRSGAEAVHPGYGFLSENPEFATACEKAGCAFIGPTPEQMKMFGLKHSARELAALNDVPLLPGSGLLESVDEAVQAAGQMAYPVMLKSTAGGGGIGMQLCTNQNQLADVFESVRRLGENNFADNGVFLEKFVAKARHIEVQIFGDGAGRVLALGERDCSTQRRNQKVIEETPAPDLPDTVRRAMQSAAIRLGQSVNYRNAGTVEFIYDPASCEFYFLEVNTRLQVEHGVTEEVYGVDLVAWMVQLAAAEFEPPSGQLVPRGHAIQARVYAEDPNKSFQPSAGLLSCVAFPELERVRTEHWIDSGLEVSPHFDPMLAKIIAHGDDREDAVRLLEHALEKTTIYGVETNIDYVINILGSREFSQGHMYTGFLQDFLYQPVTIDVLSPGTLTTIQDFPGRVGYWDVGVPPSGPYDNFSFQIGNRLLGNPQDAAGLEMTLNGPSLRFNTAARIVLVGAEMHATIDDRPLAFYTPFTVSAGQVITIGKTRAAGARAYLCVQGGIDSPDYLGSQATFTLGQLGGHVGRALRSGDVLKLHPLENQETDVPFDKSLLPAIESDWVLRVIYGPHGAPDFFTRQDIETFFSAEWEVHYNSSRTGIRLLGPKPQWARSDGGEAGMHPSNIHDNAYALGAVDFTGDMPVILGPDGPSLGGFVCPATVISADLWKLGQLRAGDKIRFLPVSIEAARELAAAQQQSIGRLTAQQLDVADYLPESPVIKTLAAAEHGVDVIYRPAGDNYLLVEYGPMILDISLRFRVHALMLKLQESVHPAVLELTPGIRSLQIHYDSARLSLAKLLKILETAESELGDVEDLEVPARIVHLPLSWDDDACRLAIEKYMQSVRRDAPWCPSNIEFIRRINGLDTIDDVKRIVFAANYLVMGLGDVYLGAPVATPLDPRHRLVTTKYNPARTWTAENSVGIGGSYLCVYGMEGPGGYQFIGRTLQMWNRYRKTPEFERPWLLRFFDQIRFFEVDAEELADIRWKFPRGNYSLHIEETRFSLKEYRRFISANEAGIAAFTRSRDKAFAEELQRWVDSGQIHYEADQDLTAGMAENEKIPDNCLAVDSPVAGNVWQLSVNTGDYVDAGQVIMVLESMKMEIDVTAPVSGNIFAINRQEGQQVNAGQPLMIIQENPR